MRSLRDAIGRMDPVRPPTFVWGGDGTEGSGALGARSSGESSLRRSRGTDPDFADLHDKGLREFHRFRPGRENSGLSLRALLDRHHHGTAHSFLFYNTFLLTGFKRLVGEKPDLAARSEEIGQALGATGYDVMALCEVFNEPERSAIVGGVDDYRSDVTHEIGWPAGGDKSSGLVTITAGRPIRRVEKLEFSNEGMRTRDADAYANKGVLLTAIDLGPGRIDLYTTHTLAGGDLQELFDPAEDVASWVTGSDVEIEPPRTIRDDQLAEAARFVQRTHHPENVALFAGDFNVGADTSEYQNLLGHLDGIEIAAVETEGGYVNLYPHLVEYLTDQIEAESAEGGGDESVVDSVLGLAGEAIEEGVDVVSDVVSGDLEGVAEEAGSIADGVESVASLAWGLYEAAVAGQHDEIADELGVPVETYTLRLRDAWRFRGGNVGSTAFETAKPDASPRDRCWFGPDDPGPHRCDDYDRDETDDTARIDYVFVADPNDYQTFDLDVSRMWRRPFWRGSGDPDEFYRDGDEEEPQYLSDHLGLEMTLLASDVADGD